MGIIERAAGVVTSFFSVRKPPQGKPPVTEPGMILVARDRQRNLTTVTVTVKSALEFVRAEAVRQNGTVGEVAGGLVAVFQRVDANIPWPESLRKYVSYAGVSPGTGFGHQPQSGLAVPAKIRQAVILESPWSLRNDGVIMQPEIVIAETKIPNPIALTPGQEVTQPPMGPVSKAPSPFSGDSGVENTTTPPPTEVTSKGRSRAPWSLDQ